MKHNKIRLTNIMTNWFNAMSYQILILYWPWFLKKWCFHFRGAFDITCYKWVNACDSDSGAENTEGAGHVLLAVKGSTKPGVSGKPKTTGLKEKSFFFSFFFRRVESECWGNRTSGFLMHLFPTNLIKQDTTQTCMLLEKEKKILIWR